MPLMKYDFGDIDLFNLALNRSRTDPPVDEYLQTVGLSPTEIAEVRQLYRHFCEAIENADTEALPGIATGPEEQSRLNPSAVN